MCGLVVLWDTRARTPPEALGDLCVRMRDTLVHRGPDDAGLYVDAATGMALGHRRLSILDLSAAGHQPMSSASGRWVVAYNGEIYNHQELRDALPAVRWKGHSDTEVLVAALERWGLESTLARLEGMFAIAAWDTRERTLWLARDRLGQKPLYWTRSGSTILAGSELRALRVHPGCPETIDRSALIDVIARFAVTQPRTILEGVSQVPPGGLIRVRETDEQVSTWWSAAHHFDRRPAPRTLQEAADAIEVALTRSVTMRAIADVPVGTLLSGGIDSTLITALLSRSGHHVRTFTIGVDDPAFDESDAAKAIASHLGTEHTTLPLRESDLRDLVPRLAHLQDEPFADVSLLPMALVSRLARQHVTVALSGDGGDELFGGYERYARALHLWRLVGRVPPLLRHLLRPVASGLYGLHAGGRSGSLPRPVVSVLRRSMQASTRDLADVYRTVTASTLSPEAYVLDARWKRDARLPVEHDDQVRRLMLDDLLVYLPSDILTKGDRASMGSSLELRSPMLDHGVVEAALSLPQAWTWAGGTGKLVLRELLARHVPRHLWERPKRGFGVPIGRWMRGTLRPWVESHLSEARLADTGLWNTRAVRTRWREHLAGADHEVLLWGVVQVQAWLALDPSEGPDSTW